MHIKTHIRGTAVTVKGSHRGCEVEVTVEFPEDTSRESMLLLAGQWRLAVYKELVIKTTPGALKL